MVKLTVIYNLPPGADHEEFLKWRTTEHQESNMSIPGILKSDFYIIKSSWKRAEVPYRYMTEAYFPDMETFEKSFSPTRLGVVFPPPKPNQYNSMFESTPAESKIA